MESDIPEVTAEDQTVPDPEDQADTVEESHSEPGSDQTAVKQPREFDLVIFGGSGFTGQYVVEEVARTIEAESGLKWAIAGRSMAKLVKVLKQAADVTGKHLEDIPILIADVSSESSLHEMCQKTRVVIDCVGPYYLYGEQVVRACIENRTHFVDISGEPVFLEKMQLLYNTLAEKNQTYIIGACGWDSIPAELGFIFTRNQGEVEYIEGYVQIHQGPDGSCGNVGTLQSAIHSFGTADEVRNIRKQLFPEKLQFKKSNMPKRGYVFKNKDLGQWCIPFVGCDRSIVMRTQRFNQEVKGQEPINFNVFYKVPNFLEIIYFMFFGAIIGILSSFNFGRTLLDKFPAIFTGGMFRKTGPTRKQIEEATFTYTFVASVPEEKKKIITRITGPEIGYASTPICLVQAVYTLLQETDKLPEKGGVLTPGAAFAETSLMDRLSEHNIKFEVIQHV